MGRQSLQAAAAVLGSVLAAFVYYGMVLDVSRGGVVHWKVVVEGLLAGVAVLTVWKFVRLRVAAAVGLAAMGMLVFAGAQGASIPALRVAQAPLSWAVMLTLAVRIAAPGSGDATEDGGEHVAAERVDGVERAWE